MNAIETKKLTKFYGAARGIVELDLTVREGEFFGFIGPNGAGKSTLIKSILGQRTYEGSITFTPAGGTETALRIGYVPQSPGFEAGDPISVQDLFACCK